MSTESGPRYQRFDDERRDDDVDAPHDTAALPFEEYRIPNEPETNQSFMERYGKLRMALAGVAAGSVLAGVIVGVGVAAKGGSKEERAPSKPGNSAPAVPGETSPSPSETAADTDMTTEAAFYPSLDKTKLYDTLDATQKDEIDKFDDMSYEVFAQLPKEDQLKFAQFYYDAYQDYGMEQLKRSPYYEPVNHGDITLNSTGQDLMADYAERRATIMYSLTENGNLYKINDDLRDDAKKAMSLVYDVPGFDSNVYETAITQVGQTSGLDFDDTQPYNGAGYKLHTVDRESPVVEAIDPLKLINVAMDDGSKPQYRFIYAEFEDATGEQRGSWRLQSIRNESNSQYIPDVESYGKN